MRVVYLSGANAEADADPSMGAGMTAVDMVLAMVGMDEVTCATGDGTDTVDRDVNFPYGARKSVPL